MCWWYRVAKSRVRIKKTPAKAISIIDKIAKNLAGPSSVKVGLPKGSNNYPDGTSLIMVGVVHEFGSPRMGIPQRSYLRSTLTGNRAKYKAVLKKLGTGIGTGKLKPVDGLKILGVMLESDVRSKIDEIKTPPLKNREGNPLRLTGHLIQSITHIVGD